MDVTHFYNLQTVLVKYRWTGDNTTVVQSTKMELARLGIAACICDKHQFLYNTFVKQMLKSKEQTVGTIFRLRLFGRIPLLKIKNNKIYLFEFIPLLTIKWK